MFIKGRKEWREGGKHTGRKEGKEKGGKIENRGRKEGRKVS